MRAEVSEDTFPWGGLSPGLRPRFRLSLGLGGMGPQHYLFRLGIQVSAPKLLDLNKAEIDLEFQLTPPLKKQNQSLKISTHPTERICCNLEGKNSFILGSRNFLILSPEEFFQDQLPGLC